MKKFYPLLSVLFLIIWGCEDKTDDNTPEVVDDTPTEVTLWGVVYSVENTDSLDLSNNQLTGEIPETICDLNDQLDSLMNVSNNHLCNPYVPTCITSLESTLSGFFSNQNDCNYQMSSKDKKDIISRLEPQSSEAEKAVLGSMLISKEAVPRGMTFLHQDSFFDKKHQIIYKNMMELFEDNSSIECNYLVISDGVFSSMKLLIANDDIKPKYFKSIAIRGTIDKKDLKDIDYCNISLFLGSNFHSVIYPVNKGNEFNFIGILRKNLSENEIKNSSLFKDEDFISSILLDLSHQIDQDILNNLKNIKCFPIFTSEEIYHPKQKNIFLIGDAFFALPPTFAQGASQAIEVAFELYKNFQNGSNEFTNTRIKRTKIINKKSKLNHFAFHLSNPFMVFTRDLLMKYLVKNKKFINSYFGKIYKN